MRTDWKFHTQREDRATMEGCSSIFADTFRELEYVDLLDTLNEVDIISLHYVFLPRINKSL